MKPILFKSNRLNKLSRELAQAAISVLIHPFAFFRNLPEPHPYGPPLIFLGLILALDLGWNAILARFSLISIPDLQGLNHAQNIFLNYASLAFSPLILWVTARLFGGKGSLRTSMAVVCYSSAPMLFPPVLWLGYLFGFYSLFLMYAGVKEAFALSIKKSVFAFLFFSFALCLASVAAVYFLFPR